MSFLKTYWKVWEVRTAIKIQESIENSISNKSRSNSYNNSSEVVRSVVSNNISWNNKMNALRQSHKHRKHTMPCEWCSKRFDLFSQSGEKILFSGFVLIGNKREKISEQVIIDLTSMFNQDLQFQPHFYCSRKCISDDLN